MPSLKPVTVIGRLSTFSSPSSPWTTICSTTERPSANSTEAIPPETSTSSLEDRKPCREAVAV